MWWKSKWAKKTKIIVSAVFGVVLAIIISFIVFLGMQREGGGSGSSNWSINNEQSYGGNGGSGKKSDNYKPRPAKSNSKNSATSGNSTKDPVPSAGQALSKSRLPYILLFIIIIVVLIILRNMKTDAKKGSDNPYVNTSLYKIPIPEDFIFPPVHFTKPQFVPEAGEKILYATPAEQKENPGDLVITDRRFVFLGKKSKLILSLGELSAISSLSNTALLLTEKSSGEEKQHYFFVRDTQMRFVLALVRWAYSHGSGDGSPDREVTE